MFDARPTTDIPNLITRFLTTAAATTKTIKKETVHSSDDRNSCVIITKKAALYTLDSLIFVVL